MFPKVTTFLKIGIFWTQWLWARHSRAVGRIRRPRNQWRFGSQRSLEAKSQRTTAVGGGRWTSRYIDIMDGTRFARFISQSEYSGVCLLKLCWLATKGLGQTSFPRFLRLWDWNGELCPSSCGRGILVCPKRPGGAPVRDRDHLVNSNI